MRLSFRPRHSRINRGSSRAAGRAWLFAALDLLAPPVCAGCGRTGAAWCRDCQSRTDRIGKDRCSKCGAPGDTGRCPACEEFAALFHEARAYALYTEPFRRIVIRLKHHPDHALGDHLAHAVLETALDFSRPADLLVPVPLSETKLAARGYNQVELFSLPLALGLGISHVPAALLRTRETRSQVGLSGEERRQNLSRAFAASPEIVAGRRVLLVDDVFTTGTTGNACARALLKAGATAVDVLTLARAMDGGDSQIDV